MQQDDGDVIRGLGFVTLYASYLEEEIDNLLELLSPVEKFDVTKQRWPTSKKIGQAKKVLRKLNEKEFKNIIGSLDDCTNLFNRRNILVHGRIYAGFNNIDTLKSGRKNVPDRGIKSEELYGLANELDAYASEIYGATISFNIKREIKNFQESA